MVKRIVWWCLTIACAASILGLSLQPVAASTQLSGSLTDAILEHNEEYQTLSESQQKAKNDKLHDRVRSTGHVVVFAVLGLCLCMLVHTYTAKRWWMIALPCGAMFAVLDECIQFFRHAGRAFEIGDIGKDWLGILIGAAAATVIMVISVANTTYKEKRRNGISGSGSGQLN